MDTNKGEYRRNPWAALALSLLSAGLGHIYCGRLVAGVVYYCSWLVLALVWITASFATMSPTVFLTLVGTPYLAAVTIWLWAAIDAFRTASKIDGDFVPRNYNRGVVYTGLAVLGIVYPCALLMGVSRVSFEAFYIPTNSMSPNVVNGDRLLVNKQTYRHREPQRGEVVVFRNPGPGAHNYIKRIVAVGGDTIEFRGHDVLINGKRLSRKQLSDEEITSLKLQVTGQVYVEENAGANYMIIGEADDARATRPDPEPMVVPEGMVYVLGDYRARSRDSRDFGVIPRKHVTGSVEFLYWPAESWSRFGAFDE